MPAYTHGGNKTGNRTARKTDLEANADWWRDAWLRDHPGKTLADYEIAGSCSDTKQGRTEFSEWAIAYIKQGMKTAQHCD